MASYRISAKIGCQNRPQALGRSISTASASTVRRISRRRHWPCASWPRSKGEWRAVWLGFPMRIARATGPGADAARAGVAIHARGESADEESRAVPTTCWAKKTCCVPPAVTSPCAPGTRCATHSPRTTSCLAATCWHYRSSLGTAFSSASRHGLGDDGHAPSGCRPVPAQRASV